MQSLQHPEAEPRPSLVAKIQRQSGGAEAYLQVAAAGRLPVWVTDPESATAFVSLREAMRVALRLPAHHRAFGVPAGDAGRVS